jgi:hypothetical protein
MEETIIKIYKDKYKWIAIIFDVKTNLTVTGFGRTPLKALSELADPDKIGYWNDELFKKE